MGTFIICKRTPKKGLITAVYKTFTAKSIEEARHIFEQFAEGPENLAHHPNLIKANASQSFAMTGEQRPGIYNQDCKPPRLAVFKMGRFGYMFETYSDASNLFFSQFTDQLSI